MLPELLFLTSDLMVILGTIGIALGVISLIWLIIHVEYGREFSWIKAISAIILASLFLGFGINLLVVMMGL